MTFDEARAAIEALIAREAADPAIDRRANSRFYHHGAQTERCTVLFHGLTNCPQQFEAFAQMLHARGENVFVPRLPRHGYKDRLSRIPGDLTVAEIETDARSAARLAASLGRRVSAAGISLGATMALWLAQTGGIDAAIGIAPFLMVPVIPRGPGMLLMRALLALPNRFLWWDPRRKERMLPPYAYPGFWTHCLAQSVATGGTIFNALAAAPPAAGHCSVVINARDPAVNNRVARELVARWQARGAMYKLVTWDGLGKVHDVVDPSTYPAATAGVYPRLLALLEGDG